MRTFHFVPPKICTSNLIEWDKILCAMHSQPADNILEQLFYDQMTKSTAMREHVAHYNRLDRGDPHETYRALKRTAAKEVGRMHREQMRTSMGGGESKQQIRTAEFGETKHCFQWQKKGSCSKGSGCQYAHASDQKGSRAKAPNQSAGANRSRSTSRPRSQSADSRRRSSKGMPPCKFHNKPGGCRAGRSCKFRHDSSRTHRALSADKSNRSKSPRARKKVWEWSWQSIVERKRQRWTQEPFPNTGKASYVMPVVIYAYCGQQNRREALFCVI